MICIPLCAADDAGMLGLLDRAAGETADLYELRLDGLEKPARVGDLVRAAARPVIATCRSLREGGGFSGSRSERRDILRRAVEAGAAYVDAEGDDRDYLAVLGTCGPAIRIASMHDFSRTPDDLIDSVRRLADHPAADWVKFAVAARCYSDSLRVFEALAKCPKPAIGVAMGDFGLVTRVLGRRFGSRVTFGSLGAGLESAPGQPSARDLAELYRVGSLTERTAVFGRIAAGRGEGAADGHAAVNRAFAAAGVDAVCIPFLGGDPGEYLDMLARAGGIPGRAEADSAASDLPLPTGLGPVASS